MRYLPLTDTDRADMLDVVGVADVDDLFCDVSPDLLMTDVVMPRMTRLFRRWLYPAETKPAAAR